MNHCRITHTHTHLHTHTRAGRRKKNGTHCSGIHSPLRARARARSSARTANFSKYYNKNSERGVARRATSVPLLARGPQKFSIHFEAAGAAAGVAVARPAPEFSFSSGREVRVSRSVSRRHPPSCSRGGSNLNVEERMISPQWKSCCIHCGLLTRCSLSLSLALFSPRYTTVAPRRTKILRRRLGK